MSDYSQPELGVELKDYVATMEIRRPPNNFFDFELIRQIADTCEALDEDPDCRAILLCAQGKSFCAGADFSGRPEAKGETNVDDTGIQHLYLEAVRVFACRKPIVAAVQGAAIGGGLGLAMAADFRVAAPEARFAANFTRLGFHPGFGLTHTLPRAVGQQNANLIFLTSRRIKGEEAHRMGLCEELVPLDQLRDRAWDLAREIATNSPLGLLSTRATMREGLAEAVRKATEHELAEQTRLRKTDDFKEGVAATAERRIPDFKGR
jgi:enoyl-CoA hydratase/carnithine racemase